MREVKRPEGTYGYTIGHIYFDCKCESKGCHYKELSEEDIKDSEVAEAIRKDAKNIIFNYETAHEDRQHTLYYDRYALKMFVENVEFLQGKAPVFTCKDCGNEFEFTSDLIKELIP